MSEQFCGVVQEDITSSRHGELKANHEDFLFSGDDDDGDDDDDNDNDDDDYDDNYCTIGMEFPVSGLILCGRKQN
jgi:hypothetical protein